MEKSEISYWKIFCIKEKKEEIKFLNIQAGFTFPKCVIFTDKIIKMKLWNTRNIQFIPAYYKYTFVLLLVFSISTNIFAQIPDPPIPIPITPNWTSEIDQASANFGTSVAQAGDVNGDGFDDVLIAAPLFDNGEADEGKVFLYYGTATGVSATAAWTYESNQINAQLGSSISGAGDVNNDGYDDVIIAAKLFDNGQIDEGKVFVFYGSVTGLSATPNWTKEINKTNNYFGYDVADAGDVNNDGYDDILISVASYDAGFSHVGIVFLYLGSATGLNSSASWNASDYDGESNYGYSLSAAGDVNGDGFDDVIVGAYATGFDGQGCVYVFHGKPGGLQNTSAWVDCGGPDGALQGRSISSAGDVNGDGYYDIIINSTEGDGDENTPVISLFHGSAIGLSESPNWLLVSGDFGGVFNWANVSGGGDVNNDGYSDIILGSSGYDNGQTNEGAIYVFTGSADGIPGSTSWISESNQANAYLGSEVANAGDINGDGYDDIIASAPFYDNGQTDEGQVYVYHGNSGCLDLPDVTLNFSDDIICSNDGAILLTDGSPSGGFYTGTGIMGTNYFNPNTAGVGTHTITYTYIDLSGCSAIASDELTVVENPAAATTLGSASLNLCVSSPVVLVANTGTDITYQWFKNNVPIPGAIYLAYLAYTTGNYQVQVTNAAGCTKMSSKKKVTHSGCKEGEEINNNELVIYPNPNNGVFNFEYINDKLLNDKVSVEIFDMQGRIVLNEIFIANNGAVNGTINSNLSGGIYQVRILQGGIYKMKSIIIN